MSLNKSTKLKNLIQFSLIMSNVCIIFDMDGVLADTGPIHYQSWKRLANEIGVEFTREFFEETFGQKSIPITKRLVGNQIEKTKIRRWANLKEKYYREMIRDKISPLPGVISLIIDLKKHKCKLAVASSGPPENVELLIESLNIRKYFEIFITAADVENGKPKPDAFLIAADKLNANPKNCVVIEDAPVGIEAAKRAGMKCIALTTTHSEEELKDANIILPDLSEIMYEDIKQLLKS